MSSPLRSGDLKDARLLDVLDVCCRGGQTTVVRISLVDPGGTELQGAVFFEGGDITDAHLEESEGLEALRRMVGLRDGRYEVEIGPRSVRRTIQQPWLGAVERPRSGLQGQPADAACGDASPRLRPSPRSPPRGRCRPAWCRPPSDRPPSWSRPPPPPSPRATGTAVAAAPKVGVRWSTRECCPSPQGRGRRPRRAHGPGRTRRPVRPPRATPLPSPAFATSGGAARPHGTRSWSCSPWWSVAVSPLQRAGSG